MLVIKGKFSFGQQQAACNNMKNIYLTIGFLLVLLGISCSHYEQLMSDPEESEQGDDESHNVGKNCGSCHNKSGNEAVREAGWWTISGTVFKSNGKAQDKAIIELWEKPGKQGKLIKRLEADELGNFYTNQIVDFNGGCYPTINVNGLSKEMGQAFNGGSCNSCHGVTTSKLEID